MGLKGVKVMGKHARSRYEDGDVYALSSDITTYNIYAQDWQALEAEGLSTIFADQADFERRKGEYNEWKTSEASDAATTKLAQDKASGSNVDTTKTAFQCRLKDRLESVDQETMTK